jgi:DNA-binding transcriptional ArsR family regulator
MPITARALRDHRLNGEADIATVAALIGDDARAAMLLALFGGGARSASQLAAEARVGAPAASKHLAKLLGGGLIAFEVRGREHRYRLASEEVAHLIETLASIAPVRSTRTLGESSRLEALRQARTCYDHLAGRLGVAIFAALVERDALRPPDEVHQVGRKRRDGLGRVAIGPEAARVFAALGVQQHLIPQVASACPDWTEDRPHLGGTLGADLCTTMLERGWILPRPVGRAVRLSEAGREGLRSALGLEI